MALSSRGYGHISFAVLSMYILALLVGDFVHEFGHSPMPLCDQGMYLGCQVTTCLLFISPVDQDIICFNAAKLAIYICLVSTSRIYSNSSMDMGCTPAMLF